MSEPKGVIADSKLFKFYGTDECKSCETGRVTLFIANEECMSCNPKSYERAEPPPLDPVVRELRETLESLVEACEFYADKGSDQERHHFLAVEARGNYLDTVTRSFDARFGKTKGE